MEKFCIFGSILHSMVFARRPVLADFVLRRKSFIGHRYCSYKITKLFSFGVCVQHPTKDVFLGRLD